MPVGDNVDAAAPDAARRPDARTPDAPAVVAVDAAPDAGCAIAPGVAPLLDGVNDLADYPADTQLAPGAALGADGAALTWDRAALYVTVTSDAFTGAFEPLHVYLEVGDALTPPAVTSGKEYSGLVPSLPFAPTHLIAVRRQSDSGTGPYDAVYPPAAGFTTQALPLVVGTDVFVSSDNRTLSARVPWAALGGCPSVMRLATHVVHAVAGNEWKELVPATTTPWLAAGGGYYEIDLTQAPSVASWTLR